MKVYTVNRTEKCPADVTHVIAEITEPATLELPSEGVVVVINPSYHDLEIQAPGKRFWSQGTPGTLTLRSGKSATFVGGETFWYKVD